MHEHYMHTISGVYRTISQTNWVRSERSRYLWKQGPVLAHILIWAHKLACMHTMLLCAQAHILVKWGQTRDIKISMESGEDAGPIWLPNVAWAYKVACMQAIFITKPNYIRFWGKGIYGISISLSTSLDILWVLGKGLGPKKRPNASYWHQRPTNSPLQELKRGVPLCPNILV